MPQRFTDEELERAGINPRKPRCLFTCPLCGIGAVVLGYSLQGLVRLIHSAYPDPTRPGELATACDGYLAVAQTDPREFLRLCSSKGVSLAWETP